MAEEHEGSVGSDFLEELSGVELNEEEIDEEWAEVGSPTEQVVSVPTSSTTTEGSGSPARASSPEGDKPPAAAAVPTPASAPAVAVAQTAAPAAALPAATTVRPPAHAGPAAAAARPRPAAAPRPTGVRPPNPAPRPAATQAASPASARPPAASAAPPARPPMAAAGSRPPAVGPRPAAAPAAAAAAGPRPSSALPAAIAAGRPPTQQPGAAAAAARPAAQPPQGSAPRTVPAAAAKPRPARPAAAGPGSAAAAAAARPGAPASAAAAARPARPTSAAAAAAPAGMPAAKPSSAGPAVAPATAAAAQQELMQARTRPNELANSATRPAEGNAGAPQAQVGERKAHKEPVSQQQQEQQQADRHASSGGGGGGGSAWGWLKAAVNDVSDLGNSFAKVLQEAAAAESDSEEEEAARRAAASAAAAARRAPPPGAESPLPPEAEDKRQAVLARLEGEESKADRMAAEAGKALSSLWGWGAQLAQKAAKEIAGTPVEEGERPEEGPEAAAPGSSSTRPAVAAARAGGLGEFRLGATLGTLGQRAQQMLERGLQAGGTIAASAAGSRSGVAPSAESVLLGGQGVRAAGEEEEDLGFDSCLYIYGGRQELEDLERMSSECARLCNRLRSKLPEDAAAQLAHTLALLQPIFDLGAEHPADGAGAEAQQPQQPEESAALARGHDVIEELAAAGCEFADELVAAVEEHAGALLEAQASPPSPSSSQGPAAVAQAVTEPSPATRPAAARALRRLQAEGTRRVAEVCSLCLERLVALARSVSSWRQTGRPATDGIVWPASCEAIGLLLRRQALRMLGDMQAMAEAFDVAVESAGVTLDQQAPSKQFGRLGAELQRELAADREAASVKISEAARALVNIVWLNSLDAEFLGN